MSLAETLNADFIDAQYQLWKNDPQAVSRDWRFFFEGFEIGGTREQRGPGPGDEDHALRQ